MPCRFAAARDAMAAVQNGRPYASDAPRILPGRPRRRFGHQRLLGLNVAAAPACAQLDAPIEAFEGGLQLLLDVGHVHGDGMELGLAAIAEPEERLRLV